MVEDKIFPVSAARDNFECACFDITDDLLMKSKIVAYMMDQQIKKTEDAEKKPYAPKAFPTKAVDIMIPLSDDFIIEIFLDTNAKAWDSKFKYNNKICKLSHEQMGQFFNSDFYKKMAGVLEKKWPLSDKTYSDLFNAVASKRMKVGFSEADIAEDELVEDDAEKKPEKRVEKKEDKEEERKYTNSGRRILHFSDNGVKANSGMYYCWPRKDAEFRWSQWRDWHKLHPFCKMEFEYNGRQYMLVLPLFDENFENRGFRGADLLAQPPLAWLTPGECDDVMKLSIVKKFTKQCVKRITKYLKMPDEEILKKINKPDKISIDEIRETKRAIKKVVDSALKTNKADTFSWK